MTDKSKKTEERLRRAREKLAKLSKATETRGRTDRMDWRPKALIWLHPDTDINERLRVWFSKVIEKDDDEKGKGKKKTQIVTIPYVVSEDPDRDAFCLFRRALEANEEIDGDDVVLVVGSGRSKVEYRKGDLLGWDDYTFKRRITPQQDFVCVAILAEDKDGKRPDKLKCEIFSGAKTLGKEIRKEIDVEVDENGEEDGNPFFKPYPFRIDYDESASGTDMYSASARTKIKSDSELEKLFDADAPDLKDEITAADPMEVYELLKGYCVVDLEFDKPNVSPEKKDDGDQVEDPPDAGDDESDDEKAAAAAEAEQKADAEAECAKEEAAKKAAKEKTAKEKAAKAKAATARKKAADAKKAAEEAEAEAKAAEAGEPEEAEPEKSTTTKKSTTRKKKVIAEPPKDDVVSGYDDPKDDPGPKPDDPNIGWWPNREDGEIYDICPKCERPVREDDTSCPHKDCGVSYAAQGPF